MTTTAKTKTHNSGLKRSQDEHCSLKDYISATNTTNVHFS